MEEIEAKFLDVEVDVLREKLKSLGAVFVTIYEYRRKLFDYPDFRLDKNNAWIRLRDEGDKITLSYKQRQGVGNDPLHDSGMKEIEVVVSNFNNTAEIFQAAGMIEKLYAENHRERWKLDGVEIDIDTWPLIPTYVEIEGSSWEAVEETAKKLSFNYADRVVCSVHQIYEKYGINNHDYTVLTFDRQIKKQ